MIEFNPGAVMGAAIAADDSPSMLVNVASIAAGSLLGAFAYGSARRGFRAICRCDERESGWCR